MKLTVLIDDITKSCLLAEWGLSIYIEYEGKQILLDGGASSAFSGNAKELGIDLTKTDMAVLSHMHADHADGLYEFFHVNDHARLYARSAYGKGFVPCYLQRAGSYVKYGGMDRRILAEYGDRITYVEGKYELCPGAYLLPHSTPGLEKIGKRVGQYVKIGGKLRPDDYSHEQSLVFRTGNGLVVLNSCSHGGADNIIKEVMDAFPGEKIHALIGGFHLFKLRDDEVYAFADRLAQLDVACILTGHCSKQRGYDLLHERLGDKVQQMYCGLTREF